MDLTSLYKENYRIVYGYLLSLCGDPALAEDLASETFLRGIRSIGRFQEGKITTWLCAIGRNLYLSERRRSTRLVPLEEAIAAIARSMEEQVMARDQAEQVLSFANALPEPKRTVFFMRIRGYSFREIGDALRQKENWARVTWFRIRQDILREMEEMI